MEDRGRGIGGLFDTNNFPSELSVPTEAVGKPPGGGRHKKYKYMGRWVENCPKRPNVFYPPLPRPTQDLSLRLLSMKNRLPHQSSTPVPSSTPGAKLATTLKEKATANWRVGKLCTQELR